MYFLNTTNSSSKQTQEPDSKQENTEFLETLKIDWNIILWRDLNIFPPKTVFVIFVYCCFV